MKNLKLITTLVLAFAFLFAQVGNVAAAPLAQDPTITGNVVSITPEADANGVITVLVELEGGQTVRISEATAIAQGLLQLDSAGQPILDANGLPVTVVLDPNTPLSVTIAPGDIIADTPEEDVHPISALLAKFFFPDDESMASVIDGYHSEDGFGFGVIAQALWMSRNLTGEEEAIDTDLTKAILQAKQDKDFEKFFEDHQEYEVYFGDTLPTNWGQFKKGLLNKKNNLGNVVSGHAEEDETSTQSLHGNGKDNGNGKGPGNNKGKGPKK